MGIGQIRIGTRGSALALAQTELVEQALRRQYPDIEIKRIILQTEADRNRGKLLTEFGGTGVFVKELERALLDREIDIAVHSAKDMPARACEELCIAGVLQREDVRDVLVYRKELGRSINDIKGKFVVGTGSPRRQSQLQALYPNFSCVGIRGNVPTRLDKVINGECDGVILAAAGLKRLGLLDKPEFCYHFFSEEEMLPAGGQAVIAIETRVMDAVIPYVQSVLDEAAFIELRAERSVLDGLNAGCHEPIAVRACVDKDEITICVARAVVKESGITSPINDISTGSMGVDKSSPRLSDSRIERICKRGRCEDWEMLACEVVRELIRS